MNNTEIVNRLIETSDRSYTRNTAPKKYALSNNDFEMGCEELGFMRFLKRNLRNDDVDWMEAEDRRYERFVRRHRRIAIRVRDGYAYDRSDES